MKNQRGNLICKIVVITVITFLCLFLEPLSCNSIFHFIAIAGVTIIFYVLVVFTLARNFNKKEERYQQEILKKAKEDLNSEFQTVFLKDAKSISNENFKCEAKIDNEKIVCHVYLNLETTFDTYEEFLEHFEVR